MPIDIVEAPRGRPHASCARVGQVKQHWNAKTAELVPNRHVTVRTNQILHRVLTARSRRICFSSVERRERLLACSLPRRRPFAMEEGSENVNLSLLRRIEEMQVRMQRKMQLFIL